VSELHREMRRVDVVILAALPLEFDAVLQVDAGAVPGSAWDRARGPSGLPIAFRPFVVSRGRPLRVAVAQAPGMGATAATNTLLPLVDQLRPRCVAMCGVCAGRRGKVELGDVIAADRLYYHDTGKQLPERIQQDLTTYQLRDDWKAALEGMDPVARFRDEPWFQARPLTTEWRLHRALLALRDGVREPWTALDPTGSAEWPQIVAALRARKLLAASGRRLTRAGRRFADDLVFRHAGRDGLPDRSPAGPLHRFRLHVAPIGSGTRVIENEAIWSFVSQAMRKTLGLEMEAAALGELAHRQRQYQLDAVVMKGVMDFADHGRDDHFQAFAARASSECLLWFLRDQLPTEPVAGFDDVLGAGAQPLPQRPPAPSLLLDARHAGVPWHDAGRTAILADLDAWADDPLRGIAARLLHAEGGAGKTRLAIEWVRRRRERHDVAGFLWPDPERDWLERLCAAGTPVVIVIDYAESRGDLVAVLRRVARLAESAAARPRIRILLLARNAGDWWAALLQHHADIAARWIDREPVELAPLAVSPAERAAVFAEAATAFARVRRLARPPRPPAALDDPRFQRALYLHMAALTAVERAQDGASPAPAVARGVLDAGALLDRVLDHEERFWVRQASDRDAVALAVPLARQLVAAATLRGGLSRDEARALCVRLEDRPRTDRDDALLALLHDIYGGGARASYLPGLEPDVLGEAIALRIAAPPRRGEPAGAAWIERVVVASDTAAAVTTAFEVLGRASATDSAAVAPWIERLLAHELPERAVLALRAAKAVGLRTAASVLGDVLADALERHGTIDIAAALADEDIPHPTVSLLRVAEWQIRTLLAHAAGDRAPRARAAQAELMALHAGLLRALGRHDEALSTQRAAIEILRDLARRDRVHRGKLAVTLSDLAHMLGQRGRSAVALATARQAVRLLRSVARDDPEYRSHLAECLTDLGRQWSAVGQHEEALRATREAAALYQELARLDAETYAPGLAISLNELGGRWADVGGHDQALEALREAVAILRDLAARRPDAFAARLAGALNNLANALDDLGQRGQALEAARESVALSRDLAARHPATFLPQLATGLVNLGIIQGAVGQRETALAVTREAAEIWRALAARDPDMFQPELMSTLTSLGGKLAALRKFRAAIAVTREAIDLGRALAAKNPGASQLTLAIGLNNLARMFVDSGRPAAGLAAAYESVELGRALATRNPDAVDPELARSLATLCELLRKLDQPAQALVAGEQAVALRRRLAERHPDAYLVDLSYSLIKLGDLQRAVGQRKRAAASHREAADVFARHPLGTPPAAARRATGSSAATRMPRTSGLRAGRPGRTGAGTGSATR
jgi:nucleoside phosphorylase/tetratricopeptide (TPR) repeat protein